MATITPTRAALITHGDDVQIISWAMGIADTGLPYEGPGWSDRSVQIAGTFGSATCTIQGSNDGTNYTTLTDPQGNAISKTAADLEAVSELTRYIRPVTTGGTGTTLTVSLLVKRVK